MTTTDEYIRATMPLPGPLPRLRLDGEEAEPDDCDCLVGPDEEAWVRQHLQHRNNLRLVLAGALGFGLALALGLSAAWQIDRWAADWHYSGDPLAYALPDRSAQPGYAE